MKPPIKNLNLAYHPLGDVTQYFGENPTLYSRFGLAGHNGIDLVRPHGEPLYAVENATVISVKNDPHGFGKNLRILSDKKNENGYYNEWVYAHTSENLVKVGDKVKAGQKIALMGNTGFTISGDTPYWKNNPYAGTHLHIGLRQAKRMKTGGWMYEGSDIRISIMNTGNGYKGAIDPLPFLRQSEAPEENKIMYRQLLTIQSIINSIRNKRKK